MYRGKPDPQDDKPPNSKRCDKERRSTVKVADMPAISHLRGRRRPSRFACSSVSRIELVPDGGELVIVLRGDLAAILTFAAGKKNPAFSLGEGGA
jgi:hypothetical protein